MIVVAVKDSKHLKKGQELTVTDELGKLLIKKGLVSEKGKAQKEEKPTEEKPEKAPAKKKPAKKK